MGRKGQTLIFEEKPVITAWASVVGRKEAEGPLGGLFDLTIKDTRLRSPNWEKAETRLQALAMKRLLEKRQIGRAEIDLVLSGDLLNQCIGSSFFLRNTGFPALGLYGACSTMAEGLLTAASFVQGGFAKKAAVLTSSHFAASERQYRFPLGYGAQRTPTSQWTVTGAGTVLLEPQGSGPRIAAAAIGTVTDKGIRDSSNMGAAMAYAAFRTIAAHLEARGQSPDDYDAIVTGDLGKLGLALLEALLQRQNTNLDHHRLWDCGLMIYDAAKQDTHCGGSGCGCSAAVLCSDLLRRLRENKLKRILFCGTGALLSQLSVQQRLPIPAICHAVEIESEDSL